jgi:type IV pilus assembly protein PilC
VPTFEYKGKTSTGAAVAGEMKARNKEEVLRQLRKKKILASSVTPRASEIKLNLRLGRIKKVHISRLTRQFSTMIGAGLPMVQCLDILANQMESAELREIVAKVKESVQGGDSLSEALARHKKAFDDLYVSMVEAGEIGGALDVILSRLASLLEKAERLRRKVKGAMVYPAVVSFVALGATVAMLTFIVPIFSKMFAGLGAELPGPTKMVLGISQAVQSNFLLGIAVVVVLAIGYKFLVKRPSGKLLVDRVKLRLPLLGDLIRKTAISRFSRTLGTLISSGVPILEALEITAKTAGNQVLNLAIQKAAISIAGGETITTPLKETGIFPPMVTQMISVGEKTGGLDEMLSKISDFYDEEVDAAVAAVTSVIEPIIIVILGVVMGGILIAMYLPMFDIIGAIG